MIEPPRISHTDEGLAAVIRLTIPRSEIQNVMGPSIGELIAEVTGQGIAITGPVFSHHLRMDPDVFDFEIGVPIGTKVTPSGRVIAGRRPAAKVAHTVYHGGYEGLADAWTELMSWIESQGHEPAADLWESYVAGPESSPDPANWRTELNRPLVN